MSWMQMLLLLGLCRGCISKLDADAAAAGPWRGWINKLEADAAAAAGDMGVPFVLSRRGQ